MTVSRIYLDQTIEAGSELRLPKAAAHHVARVLRLRVDETLTLFNGRGGEYAATIESIERNQVRIRVGAFSDIVRESPLRVCLAQGISRGERMDLTIQKAVELGVTTIVPLLTTRCTVKLDDERRIKRLQHWQSVIVSACEQSGRNQLPELLPVQAFGEWLETAGMQQVSARFILSGTASQGLSQQAQSCEAVNLIAGPEGGFTDGEVQQAVQAGYIPLRLGPRILRTETAALAAISAMQARWGDFGG